MPHSDSVLMPNCSNTSSGTIGSRTWALDQGLTGDPSIKPNDWVDGQLTIGGYDESRYSGEMFPLKIDEGLGCPLKVTVERFIYNFPNGTAVDLRMKNDPYLLVLSSFSNRQYDNTVIVLV